MYIEGAEREREMEVGRERVSTLKTQRETVARAHLALRMSIVANCASIDTKCLYFVPYRWHATILLMSSSERVSYLSFPVDLAPYSPKT